MVGGHFCLADAHEKSVAHRLTYGEGSGYRKHIIAALYRRAAGEQGKVPVRVSLRTAALFGEDKKNTKIKRSKLQLQLQHPRQMLV